MNYPYSHTITLRRGRQEIINSYEPRNYTVHNIKNRNPKKLIGNICKLTEELQQFNGFS